LKSLPSRKVTIAAYGDVPTSVRAMKAGAVEFLTKPLDDDALLSAIRHAIERSSVALGDEAENTNVAPCAFTVISLIPSFKPTCLFSRPETIKDMT
jgi:FixJ family two-component response regulator